MAHGHATYRHRMLQGSNKNFDEPSVLIKRRPGFDEFQTEGTETEKARDAKVEYSYDILDRVLGQ